MSDLIDLQLKHPNVIFGASASDIPGTRRDPKWPHFLAGLIEKNPRCIICGTAHGITGHHVIPVHVDRTLELVEGNIGIVCQVDHLLIGHLHDWRSWNKDFWKWVEAFKNRPYSSPKKSEGGVNLLGTNAYDWSEG